MKKNKYNGWTLVELLIALTIIVTISVYLVATAKPFSQKSRLFLYAVTNNLGRASVTISQEKDGPQIPSSKCASGYDCFCLELADLFSLKGSPNCQYLSEGGDINTPNLTLANGTSISGLAVRSSWKHYCGKGTGCGVKYKDIMVDIDGLAGKNKLWVDRFPLRIFDGGQIKGLVYPVNCGSSDVVYDTATNSSVTLTSPYCSAGSKVEVLTSTKFITYDIYRADAKEDGAQAFMKYSGLSPMEADCGAYGGTTFHAPGHCAAKSFTVFDECLTKEFCNTCETKGGVNLCPGGTKATCEQKRKNAETGNPNNIQCFTYLHKPRGGMNLIIDSIVGDMEQ